MKTNTTPILSATFSEIEKAHARIEETKKYICAYLARRSDPQAKTFIHVLIDSVRRQERMIGRLEIKIFEMQNGL